MGDLEIVQLVDGTENIVQINSKMEDVQKTELVELLKESLDVFAWCPTDMSGIDPKLICHRRNTDGRPRGL